MRRLGVRGGQLSWLYGARTLAWTVAASGGCCRRLHLAAAPRNAVLYCRLTLLPVAALSAAAAAAAAAGQGVYVLMSGLDYERLVLSAGPLGLMQVGQLAPPRGGRAGVYRGPQCGGLLVPL